MFKFVNFNFLFYFKLFYWLWKKKIADQLDFYMLFKCMYVLAEIDMIRATLIKTANSTICMYGGGLLYTISIFRTLNWLF